MSDNDNNKNIEEVAKWYFDCLEILKEFSIEGGSVADNNTQIIMGIYKHKGMPVNLGTFRDKCNSLVDLDMKTKDWPDYVDNYSKSPFGSIIFKASIEKNNPNVFSTIVKLSK